MSEQNIDRLFERQKQATTLSEYRRIQCVYLKEKHGYTSTQIADITTYHPAPTNLSGRCHEGVLQWQ